MRKSRKVDIDVSASAVESVDTPASVPPPKKVAIFFSGGIDSTYLVYDALRKGYWVYLYYANGTQSPIKTMAEKYARQLIVKALTKMALPGKIIDDTELDVTKSVNVPSGAWSMTFYWFMSATQVPYHHRVDEIWFGVIWGDELWGVAGFMSTAWSNLMSAIYPTSDKNALPSLIYPIAYMNKHQLRKELPEELLKFTWYCEMPKFFRNKPKACGGCLPCLKRAMDDKLVAEERALHDHVREDIPRFRAFEKKREKAVTEATHSYVVKKRSRKSRRSIVGIS